MTSSDIDRKIAVIFATDVVGYSKHMEKDENATLRGLRECNKIIEFWGINLHQLTVKGSKAALRGACFRATTVNS